jgi:hypothetical protein
MTKNFASGYKLGSQREFIPNGRKRALKFWGVFVRGASKIILKKVNKKRTVTVRGVIIFLNISRRPLRICLHCCLHQYKTLKVVATAMAVIVLLTPPKNLNKVFWVFLVVSPLFNHYQGYE